MSRARTRTALVSLDVVNPMLTLFGSIQNAYRQLGLTGLLTYSQFYRAMSFLAVEPAQRDLIEQSWDRWRYLFLRDQVPLSSDLVITLEARDTLPPWHPDSDEEETTFDPSAQAGRKGLSPVSPRVRVGGNR